MRLLAACLGLATLATAWPALADTPIRGSGSTFVAPFLGSAFATYSLGGHALSISYQPNGSGAGIDDLIRRNVDFCATDVPLNAREIADAGGAVVQIPIALGGVAVTYNLAEPVPGGLHLTRDLVAAIFLGRISTWNDPALARANPRASLPALPITVVHRSDGSGTTYIFSDFLASVSPDWKRREGVGKDVRWNAPRAIGAPGNDGVAQAVAKTPGAIGYVELTYAEKTNLLLAWIANRAGAWLVPNEQSIQAAARAKGAVTAMSFSLVDSAAKDAYPIAGYSWLAVRRAQGDPERTKAMRSVFTWLAGPDAQSLAAGLYYVPLPENARETARKAIDEIGR